MILTFLLPIPLITVFAFAFGGGNGKGTIDKIPLLVSDEDNSVLSQQTVTDLDSVKLLNVILCKYDSGINLVKTGKRAAIFDIPKGFSDSVKASKKFHWKLEYDAAESMEMGMLQQLLAQGLYRGKVVKMAGEKMITNSIGAQFPGMDSSTFKFVFSKIKENFGDAESDTSKKSSGKSSGGGGGGMGNMNETMKLETESVVSAELTSPGLVHAVAGTAVMMLLFSLTGMGGSLLDEKEQGTLKRLLYSPIHPSQIMLGKMFASILVACVQLTIMFTFTSFVFGLKVHDKILPLALVILATAFACSGFGVFLATIAKSRSQLQGLSTLIILSMSVLGGSMVPTFIMPSWMQNISCFTLNYWSVQGFYDVLWRQLPLSGILLMRLGILLLIGACFILLSFRFFRKNVLALD